MSDEKNDISNDQSLNNDCHENQLEVAHSDDEIDDESDSEKDYEADEVQKEELYAAAYFLFQHKQYSKSSQIFSMLCQLYPHDARFYRGMGACWEKEGELTKAARAYKHASMMRVTDAMLHYQYAFCLVRLGQYDEAAFPLAMTIANAGPNPNQKGLVSKANAMRAYIEKCKGEKNV